MLERTLFDGHSGDGLLGGLNDLMILVVFSIIKVG